ncbi:MAG TPA: SPFH domain-containing protein [Firmicutes bacterium]|nr:SPFH domain-containing protein [Bacillota bacterium]
MSEFIEVLEVTDNSENEIIKRIPEQGSLPIKIGAQLIVREHQRAVFYRDGKALDAFGPGRHTVTTANLPILTKALSLPFGFKSPFRAEVVFVNSKVFLNMKWGTKNPIALKDKELGVVNLRAFGVYSMRIIQPVLFVNQIVGARGVYDTKPLEDFFRDMIASRVTDLLGETVTTVFDLPARFDELSKNARERMTEDFKQYGIELKDFAISSINPPEEVQQMIDERSGMGLFSDSKDYLQFKAARAMGDAAAKGEGSASEGMGLGIGAGLGFLLPGMVGTGQVNPGQEKVPCPACGAMNEVGAKFCASCGEKMMVVSRSQEPCPACGRPIPLGAKFCPHCGEVVQKKKCPSCGNPISEDNKFCPHCGHDLKKE